MNHGRTSTLAAAAAALAALVVSSAPAASGAEARAQPFPDGGGALWQTTAVEKLEHIHRVRAPGRTRLSPELAVATRRPTGGSEPQLRVVVESADPASSRAAIAAAGGRVERAAHGLVQALVPRARLASLSGHGSIELIRSPFRRVVHAITGEGVATTLAGAWHDRGLRGRGVKVAVIDAGFAGLAERQAEGEVPASAVAVDLCGGKFSAEDHGTGVAEIVHEMAPEAELHLVCVDTEVDLAAAVAYAKSHGIRVVNHSMGWFGPSRGDGSGYIGDLVAGARAAGILWVNSAGNEAQNHWSGTFSGGGDLVHDWAANGDEGNSFVWPNGSEVCGLLKWDEWPAGISDFDLALVDSETNRLVAISDGYQTGSEPPVEGLCVTQATGRDLVVFWAILGYDVRTSPRLDLFSHSPPLQYQVAAGSVVDPATSSAALAVGALCWQTRQLEPYSSQGPTIDGRTKPDLVGHDSVSSATYGAFTACPSAFAGTSASAPEVAGAAALVQQAYPTWGPAAVQAHLLRSARDLLTAGPDNATGAGELQLPPPPDLAAPRARALAASGRAGTRIRLVSRVSDDSGEVRIVAHVKRGGRVIATLRRGFVAAPGPTTIAVPWLAPGTAGTYGHCVVASDRAGNASLPSCARVVVT